MRPYRWLFNLLRAHAPTHAQALHGARVHTEGEFDAVCEETQLSDKLHAIEELCESHLTAQSKK